MRHYVYPESIPYYEYGLGYYFSKKEMAPTLRSSNRKRKAGTKSHHSHYKHSAGHSSKMTPSHHYPGNPFIKLEQAEQTSAHFQADDLQKGLSHQHHKVYVAKPKKTIGYGNHLTYENLGLIQSKSGLAHWQEIASIGNIQQWFATTNTLGPYTAAQSPCSFFDVNPARGVIGSMFWGSQVNVSEDKYVLQTTRLQLDVTNFSTAPAFVNVWVFQAKNHSPRGVLTTWYDSMTDENLGNTAYGLNTSTTVTPVGTSGVQTINALAGTEENSSIIGLNPQSCLAFRGYWKEKKCVRLFLGGGATERVSFEFEMNMLGNKSNFAELNAKAVYYPRGCIDIAMEHYGTLAKSTATGSSNLLPVHAISEIGYTCQYFHKFKQVKASTSRFQTQIAAAAEQTDVPLANQTVVTIQDGIAAVNKA